MENYHNFFYKIDTVEYRELRFLFCLLDVWKKYNYICKENKIEFPDMETIIWKNVLNEYGYFNNKSKNMPNLSEIIDLQRLHTDSKRKNNNEIHR